MQTALRLKIASQKSTCSTFDTGFYPLVVILTNHVSLATQRHLSQDTFSLQRMLCRIDRGKQITRFRSEFTQTLQDMPNEVIYAAIRAQTPSRSSSLRPASKQQHDNAHQALGSSCTTVGSLPPTPNSQAANNYVHKSNKNINLIGAQRTPKCNGFSYLLDGHHFSYGRHTHLYIHTSSLAHHSLYQRLHCGLH